MKFNPYLVDDTYWFKNCVPKRYESVERKKVIVRTLKIDSESVAIEKAKSTWTSLIDGWEALLAGDTDDAEKQFAAARNYAQTQGFRYLPMNRVVDLDDADLLKRIEAIEATPKYRRKKAAAPLLGAVDKPKINLKRALEFYWHLTRDRLVGKSKDQIRRWENPRKKAIKNFIAVVGNLPLEDIEGDDMLDFTDYWQKRMEKEGITANSANKDLVHLSDIFRTVNKKKLLNLVLPLSDLAFKEGDRPKRPAFSTDWISTMLLAPGAMDGLNKEAKCVLLGMINTGYALNNATLGYGLALANKGLKALSDPHLMAGLNVHEGKVTYAPVANELG